MKFDKPGIVVMEKITKQIVIIEGNVPGDMNISYLKKEDGTNDYVNIAEID